jgi:small subunit ribosomal protein S17
MAQEEKDEQQQPGDGEQPEQAPAEEPAADAAPAEAAEEPVAEEAPDQEPTAEEPTAEEPPAEEPPAEEPPAADAPAAQAATEEPAEQLSPSMRRRMERSRASGPPRPQRSPEERMRERGEERARKSQARRRWRQKRKNRDSASGITGGRRDAEPLAREPGKRKSRQGVVVSSKPDRTITVRIDRVGRHRVYGKVVRETTTLHAHDERNEANEGDVVRVVESRPLSRTKRWRLVEVLEKAR